MALQWTQALSVGVDEIDNQHKELFNRINNLHTAISQGKGKEDIAKVIKFLEDYVITHFGAEERYMTRYDYPGYLAHKAQHTEFIKDFSNLKKEFETQGATSYLVIQVNLRVGDWLINHIGKVDKALGTFLETKI